MYGVDLASNISRLNKAKASGLFDFNGIFVVSAFLLVANIILCIM